MTFSKLLISQSLDYITYRKLIDNLLLESKTTGDNHSAAMINYTRMNVHRMGRLDKTVKLNHSILQSLSQLNNNFIWLVITEAWCGDAAQVVSVLNKIAENSEGKITLRFILRDENLEIMERYLTNGSKAIPKLIVLDKNLNEITNWGPRPQQIQEKVSIWRADDRLTHDDWSEKLHTWYAKDKTQETQKELLELVNKFML